MTAATHCKTPALSLWRLALLSLAAPVFVSAHGLPKQVAINGQVYPGPTTDDNGVQNENAGAQVNPKSPFRRVSSAGWDQPVRQYEYDAGSEAGICGAGANKEKAGQTVEVKGGSQIFIAHGWRFAHYGVIHAYMADCKGSCDHYFPSAGSKDWFKTEYLGLDTNVPASGQAMPPGWPTCDYDDGDHVEAKNTITYPVWIPDLKPGEYLLRTELDFFYNDKKTADANFQTYPRCLQLKVTGSGTAGPESDEMIAFPDQQKGWKLNWEDGMDPAKWVPNGGAHVIKGGHCRGQQCGLSISGPTAYTKVTLHSQTDPNIKPDDKNSPSAPSGASQIESADVATQLPSATSAHKVEQQQVSKVDPALPTNTVVPTLSDATLKPVMPTSIPATASEGSCKFGDYGKFQCGGSGTSIKFSQCAYTEPATSDKPAQLNWIALNGCESCTQADPVPICNKPRLLQ